MLGKLKYIIPVAILLASCKKNFLDINVDPNNPSTVEASLLLPTAERNLGDALAIGGGTNGGLGFSLEVYVHRLSTREEPDKYGATGDEYFLGLAWPKLYVNVLHNLEIIINNSKPAGNTKYAGIAEILKAYTYSQMVDVFGDVPFSEATKLDQNLYAKFDNDAEIYPKLLALLDTGIADLNKNAPNLLEPGDDDVIYGGDVELWTKAANTIKLKLYTQLRKVENVASKVYPLIQEGNLINSTDESFLLPYGPSGATDDRNPGYADYYASQRTNYISPWFYELMRGYNPRINKDNRDPRIPFYFYKQLTADEESENPTEYRDINGFASIYFGSVGSNRDHNQQNSMTILGMYPVGGRYDDGKGETASSTSGTGAAPYRFITYADRLYLTAELVQAGVIPGSAKDTLKMAIEESFKQVDYVITNYVKPSQSVPKLWGTAADTAYIDKVMTEFNTGSNEKKMEIIMTQKWISSFGSSVDAYTDYRRTGYPVFFNPNDPSMAPGGKVQPPMGDQVPVLLTKSYPLSLSWYQRELETNPKAPQQKSPSTYKVFWMP